MKVLIIGGTRFIGTFVVELLLSKGHELALFHRKKLNNDALINAKHIYGDFEKVQEKITEIRKFSPDIVLDMIAKTEEHANRLIALCNKINCKKVVVISSGDVYRAYENIIGIKKGNIRPVPIKEGNELRTIYFPLKSFNMGKTANKYEKILIIVRKFPLTKDLKKQQNGNLEVSIKKKQVRELIMKMRIIS